MPDRTAYIDGLQLLGRRELSVKQLRERLLEREHSAEDVDRAIALLVENKALDDAQISAVTAASSSGAESLNGSAYGT